MEKLTYSKVVEKENAAIAEYAQKLDKLKASLAKNGVTLVTETLYTPEGSSDGTELTVRPTSGSYSVDYYAIVYPSHYTRKEADEKNIAYYISPVTLEVTHLKKTDFYTAEAEADDSEIETLTKILNDVAGKSTDEIDKLFETYRIEAEKAISEITRKLNKTSFITKSAIAVACAAVVLVIAYIVIKFV